MANTTWKLSKTLQDKLSDMIGDLRGEVEELRAAQEEKSETWQESDRGTAVDAWLEGWEDWIEQWEGLDNQPE